MERELDGRAAGVAELLASLVPYSRGYGTPGEGGPLDDRVQAAYERALADNMTELAGRARPGDVVIVHDPQPAGLIGKLRRAGAAVIWRCHVGLDYSNELAREARSFVLPYLGCTPASSPRISTVLTG